ncbi:MAG: hypothetical protein KBI14_22025, partial [Kofleriaceae bacterium]|nr:hypothetical protein [Kofleriaceae bacterium]
MAVPDDPRAPVDTADAEAPTARPVVLCVDDEPHNLDLLDRALRRRCEVLTEALPEAALAVLAERAD